MKSNEMILSTVEDTAPKTNMAQVVAPQTADISKFVRPRKTRTVIRTYNHKVGRNEPCPCGSGKKFKNCCMGNGKFDGTRELTAQEMAQCRYGTKIPTRYKVDF